MDTDTRAPFSFDESPALALSPAPDPFAPPLPPPPLPAPPKRRYAGVAALATACALVGSAVGVVAGRELAPAATVSTAVGDDSGAVSVSPAAPESYVAVAAKVLPSVVSIAVGSAGGRGSGSGVVIREDGYVLTNNHVIDGATTIRVTFNDGSSADGTVVGADAASDLAVVKVGRTGLAAARLGRSSTVRVGDPVLAVGSPLGLSGTVTAGIVSALNRPVNTTSESFFGQAPVTTVIDAIQTDAAINPGNSGGALVDLAGQVIGINSAIASTSGGNVGVGFAIPIDQAKVIAQQLIDTGRARRAQLGVSVGTATVGNGDTRAVIQDVTLGGPAERAGLRAGDAIVKVGGTLVSDADALIATIRSHRPGQTVEVTYERDGSRQTVRVTLSDATAG